MRTIDKRLKVVGVIAYYILAAIIVTYPLVTHLSTKMIGHIGDNLYFVWLIDWFKKALFELHVNPFNIWFLNYPAGWSLAYTEITPAQLALAMPFAILRNAIFGYNMSMLLTFVLSGLTMHCWIKNWTGHSGIALAAGTAYSILPYHLAHFLIGHLNISGIQWFPLYFWALFELLEFTRSNGATVKTAIPRKFIWMLGISLGLIAWTSMYYVYMTLIISGVLIITRLFRKPHFTFAGFKALFWGGLVSLPFLLTALWPYIQLNMQGGLADRDLALVRQLAVAASVPDYVLPSSDHFLFGNWVNQAFDRTLWIENSLYVGLIVLLLAVYYLFKSKKDANRKWQIYLTIGILSAFVLSLGTDLHWFSEAIVVKIPAGLAGMLGRQEAHIPLPGLVLFKFLPFFSKLRVFSRFAIFVHIFLIVLMAFGLNKLLSKRLNLKYQRVILCLVLILIWFEFYPGPYPVSSSLPVREVDAWLREAPDTGAVIEFPVELNEDQEAVFATATHGKPFVGGFFNAFPPEQYQNIHPVLANFPDAESVHLLKELKVRYILVHADQYPDFSKRFRDVGILGLRDSGTFEQIHVYELP